MAYKVWHSPVKTTVLGSWKAVEVYYQVQFIVSGHYPIYWEEITEEEYIKKRN